MAEWFERFEEATSRGTLKPKRGRGSKAASAAERTEVAARFYQATAELQFLGLIKPSSKRKVEAVHRCVHMPALH